MIATTENKAGVGPEYLDASSAGIAQRLETLGAGTTRIDERGMYYATFLIADLVMQIERERIDAFRQGQIAQREELAALKQTIEAFDDELARAKSVVQDMTAIIAAKCEQERTLAEQIAQAIGPMRDTAPSDMELPELVGALIDFALGEHARVQVMSVAPEDDEAPQGVFQVLNADGCITGPIHDTYIKARDWVDMDALMNCGKRYSVVRLLATCTTRTTADWTEA